MAINKKLIHFNKKEDFEREVANENILNHSIVFIKDTKEIYTHGTIYGNNNSIKWSNLDTSMEFVDLGFNVYWASCNLGATKPEDTGLFYAWGETEGYRYDETGKKLLDADGNPTTRTFSEYDYKWIDYSGSDPIILKYHFDFQGIYEGVLDYKITLDPEDDAANVACYGTRIPNLTDFGYIKAFTTQTREVLNGVNVLKITSNINGNFIYFPIVNIKNIDTYYWTNSINSNGCESAYCSDAINDSFLEIGSYGTQFSSSSIYRYFGCLIRPVLDKFKK